MDQITRPLKFKPNRVKRLYRGGSGIDRLRGAAPVDSNYPEDWIASCVEGNTREFVAPGHGLSVCELDGQELPFPRLLREHAAAMLGPEHLEHFGAAPGVLAKLLDSAVLLPLQVHPDSASARRHFHSGHGKTEAWIILATREIDGEKPYLLLGFNERLDTERFRRESLDGELHAALGMLHKFEVAPGDVFVVQGRMPHAIGPGITMVEVMEPTDYVIIPERNCFGKELTLEKRFAGLPPEDALDIFAFTPSSREEVVRRCRPEPELIERRASGSSRRLISRNQFKFFEAQELRFDGVWELDLSEKSFRIGVVVEGGATLDSGLELVAGDSFFIPYAASVCRFAGRARIMLVLPPVPQAQRSP